MSFDRTAGAVTGTLTHPTPDLVPPAAAVPWTDLLSVAADDCLAALLEVSDQDWSQSAHGLDWSCRETVPRH